MRTRTVGKIAVIVMAVIAAATAASGVPRDVMSVEIYAPDTVDKSEDFSISASAEGTGLTSLEIWKEVSYGWKRIARDYDCYGESCDITVGDAISDTGDTSYRAEAEAGDIDDGTVYATVTATEKFSPGIHWDIFPTRTEVDETYSIEAEATADSGGLKGKYVEIKYRTRNDDTWSGWDSLTSSYCGSGEDNRCSASTEFTPKSPQKHEFRARLTENYGGGEVFVKTEPRYMNPEKSDLNRLPSVSLSSPAAGARDLSLKPEFRWSGTDPDGDDLTYRLMIEKARSAEKPWTQPDRVYTTGSESFSIPDSLSPGTEYVWGVKVKDSAGIWRRSGVRSFTTREKDIERPVSHITLVSPIDHATVSQSPSFIFRASDPDSDQVDYQLRIEKSEGNVWVNPEYTFNYYSKQEGVNFLATPSLNLERGASYTWGVKAKDQTGVWKRSAERSFTVEKREAERPTARLEVRPNPAHTGQQVTFDARGSSANGGTIQEYQFDIDGDGSYEIRNNDRGVVDFTFYSERDRDAKVKVLDSEGLSDTASRSYEVLADDDSTPCDVDVGTLSVYPRDINRGDETDASITVYNNMGDMQTVRVEFTANGETRSLTRDIESDGQETFSRSFMPDRDVTVKAKVKTVGDSCGDRTVSVMERDVDVRTDSDKDEDEAELEVHVEDDDGDDLEDARVEVENGDDRVRYTDDDGDTSFRLEPDNYDVEVSKNGYRTETKDIELDEGDEEELKFELERRDREITVETISFNDRVCEGSDFRVRVMISNYLDHDEDIELKGSGLGSFTTAEFEVEEGETVVETLVFPDVERESFGERQEFRITVDNGDRKRFTRTVRVVDCDFSGPRGRADSISMSVTPDVVLSGEPVHVTGYVDGVRGRSEVDIAVNGLTHATVSTAPDGYYQAFITMSGAGEKTITASTGTVSAARQVRVAPTASIGFVEAPERAFQGETFRVCGRDIHSDVNARVYLIRNGEILEAKNGVGTVCFDVSTMETGTQEYRVAAVAGNQRDVASKTVEVLEVKEEATNFPDQIASVESGSGMVKVTLYNDQDTIQRYNLRLEGIPGDWTSQTDKQAVLTPGQQREVFFYVTPEDEGEFSAELEIEKSGTVVHRQEVTVTAGGTTEPQERGFLERLLQALTF